MVYLVVAAAVAKQTEMKWLVFTPLNDNKNKPQQKGVKQYEL
jgi:hypothetical protein